MTGELFVVATPIGNLDDVSERARATLASVDAVLSEDTRVTGKLLHHLGIKKELIAYHEHTDFSRTKAIMERLERGEKLALVTDAGTPAISDPGGKLVEAVVGHLPGVRIIPIPGPSAVIAALSVSGFPANEFVFLGFPPHKKGRKKFFNHLSTIESTVVLYESTHRILNALERLEMELKDRRIVVCRELTKMYESIYRGTASQITEQLAADSTKGEFVIVLGPLSK